MITATFESCQAQTVQVLLTCFQERPFQATPASLVRVKSSAASAFTPCVDLPAFPFAANVEYHAYAVISRDVSTNAHLKVGIGKEEANEAESGQRL